MLPNAAEQDVRWSPNEEYQRDVPAIAREKPVLEALNGAKYSNQTASEVTSRVPAKSTRIVTHLPDSENINRYHSLIADVPAEVHVSDRDAAIPVDTGVSFALERVLGTVGTDRSYRMVNPWQHYANIATTH